MSLLCLVWDETSSVSITHRPGAFARDFPSCFERDVRLRAPPLLASGTSGNSVSSNAFAPLPLFIGRHVASCGNGNTWTSKQGAETVMPHATALVKSSLQKAVRRGLPRAAVAASAYLLAHEPKELLRRLPVILCEDVGIFIDLPRLTWLMVAVQGGYELNEADLHFILSLAAAAAMHPDHTMPPTFDRLQATDALRRLLWPHSGRLTSSDVPQAKDCDSLGAGETETSEILARCLAIRACYGGMHCDVELLMAFAANPSARTHIVPPAAENLHAVALADEWLHKGLSAWLGPLELESQLEVAVDFHCSDIVSRFGSFLRTRLAAPDQEELKSAIWHRRSGVNVRCQPTVGLPPSWWNAAADAELARLSRGCWAERRGARAPPDSLPSKRSKNSGEGSGSRQLSILRFATTTPAAGA